MLGLESRTFGASTVAVFALLTVSVAASASVSRSAGHLGPARPCTGAIAVTDPAHDLRSWVIPPRLPEPQPVYGDLRKFEVKSTAAGVCIRWTTAATVPVGATVVFSAGGPFIRMGGGGESFGYGFDLVLRKDGAVATFGLDRINSRAARVVHVQAGQTGSVISAFVPIAELNRPPANMPTRPPFPWRGFTFEARVITAPDPRGNQLVDFWPQETHVMQVAADINGRLCFPCHDRRFMP